MAKKLGLGRGLDALLGSTPATALMGSDIMSLRELPIEQIQRGRYQPRDNMNQDALAELAESIRSQGVVQPLVVRQLGPEKYEIIAGERRWRAAQMAGLREVPCVLRDATDKVALAIALIENIQREDLTPLEEARALERLRLDFELTHQEVADAVGRSRASVSNLLRLMDLNEEVKTYLESGKIEMGHARALLGLEGQAQTDAAVRVVTQELTVRQTEELVRKCQQRPIGHAPAAVRDPDIMRLERNLSEKLGAKVLIQTRGKKGRLVIQYHSLEELEGILAHIN